MKLYSFGSGRRIAVDLAAGPELLNLCAICDDSAILLDIYDTPVQVNTEELRAIASQLWQEQMNAWHAEYEEMSKQR